MGGPDVSVVVPVYNAEEFLARCVDSILSQDVDARSPGLEQSLELILVDDGSSDASGCMCDEYALRDERVKVVHQENSGVSAARNAGLSLATGEFVMFVDADDYLVENTLFEAVNGLRDSGCEFAVCDSHYTGIDVTHLPSHVSERERITGECASEWHYQFRFVFAVWVCIFTTKLIARDRFNVSLHSYEDWEFMSRVLEHTRSIAVIHVRLYHHEPRESSLSSSPLDLRMASSLDIPHLLRARVARGTTGDAGAMVRARLVLALLYVAAQSGVAERGAARKLRRSARISVLEVVSRKVHIPVHRFIYLLCGSVSIACFRMLLGLRLALGGTARDVDDVGAMDTWNADDPEPANPRHGRGRKLTHHVPRAAGRARRVPLWRIP